MKKRNMSLSSKDIIVTVTALGVIAAASYGLYRDFMMTSAGTQEQIGTITYKKKTAERKFSSRSTWEGLAKQAPVYNHDTIRTADGASAVVNLNDGTVIDLDENTLVVLAVDKGESSVDVGSGSLYAKGGGGDSDLTVRSKGASVSTKKGALSFALGKDDVKLNMVSGGASVKMGGSVQALSGNDAIRMAGGKVENNKSSVILESPAPSAFIIVSKGGSENVRFSWKGEVEKPVLLIGKTRSLKNADKLKSTSATGTTATKKLSAGEYFWRVVSGNGDASDVRKFVVVEDSEIQPLSPKGTSFTSVDEKPMISLRWSESSLAAMYEMDVSRDRGFREITKSVRTKSTSIGFDPPDEGEYFWRVRGVYPDGSRGAISDTATFTLSRSKNLPPPDLVSPGYDEKIGVAALEQGVSFIWRAVEGASGYRIEVAHDTHFSQAVSVETKTNNAVIRKGIETGPYFWRVVAISPKGHSSSPSDMRPFEMINVMGVELVPAHFEPGKGVVFSWKDGNNAPQYRIELAKDKSFSSTVFKKEIGGRKITVPDLPDGELFWRVSPLSGSGKIITVSGVEAVRVMAVLETPMIIAPAKNEKIEIARLNKIEFKWKKVSGASAYRFEIYKSALGGEKKVYEEDITKNTYAFSKFDLLSNGTFSWQVRALRKVGTTVDKMSSPSKEFFTIPAGPNLKAPNVRTIKVYVE